MRIKIKQFPVHYHDGESGPEYLGLPQFKSAGAAGMDIQANESVTIAPMETKTVRVGVGVEIPEEYVVDVRPRSGLSKKGILVHYGTVDSDYRGEIAVIITNLSGQDFRVTVCDRIAQLVVSKIERPEMLVVPELGATERGSNGFGSTGTR